MQNQNCRNWIITISIIFALMNISCDKYKKTEETKFILGTVINIKIYQADEAKAKTAIKNVFDEFERIDRIFSNFKKDSFISKINKNSGTWVEVPEEVIDLISNSIE